MFPAVGSNGSMIYLLYNYLKILNNISITANG